METLTRRVSLAEGHNCVSNRLFKNNIKSKQFLLVKVCRQWCPSELFISSGYHYSVQLHSVTGDSHALILWLGVVKQ